MKFTLFGIFLFLASVSANAESIYGKYESISTIGIGLFGGDRIEIRENGFSHQVTTDYSCPKRECPELHRPPHKKYQGKYTLEGNKITFISKHMREKVFYFVKIKEWNALLTEKSYEEYVKNGVVPNVIIAKQTEA